MLKFLTVLGAVLIGIAMSAHLARASVEVVDDPAALSASGGDFYEGRCTVIKPCSQDTCSAITLICLRCVGTSNWQDCDEDEVVACNVSGQVVCGQMLKCSVGTMSPCVCVHCSPHGQCIRDSCVP